MVGHIVFLVSPTPDNMLPLEPITGLRDYRVDHPLPVGWDKPMEVKCTVEVVTTPISKRKKTNV